MPVKASREELRSVLKQAFEACGYELGTYEMAANLIVWSQMHGLDVFDFVDDLLLPVEHHSGNRMLIEDAGTKLIFDLSGGVNLVQIEQLSNLAYAKASKQKLCSVEVANCKHPILLTKIVADAKHYGLNALAHWFDSSQHEKVLIRSHIDQSCPLISYYQLADGNHSNSIFLAFARDNKSLKPFLERFSKLKLARQLKPEQLAANYHRALINGIEIDSSLFRKLQEISAAVLVKSNEQSRKGAGD